MNTVVVHLANSLTDSSLNSLFKQTYDSTIGEIKRSFDSIQKQATEDHQSFLTDYYILKNDYDSMKKKFDQQTRLVDDLQKSIRDLTSLVSSYEKKVTKLTNR